MSTVFGAFEISASVASLMRHDAEELILSIIPGIHPWCTPAIHRFLSMGLSGNRKTTTFRSQSLVIAAQ